MGQLSKTEKQPLLLTNKPWKRKWWFYCVFWNNFRLTKCCNNNTKNSPSTSLTPCSSAFPPDDQETSLPPWQVHLSLFKLGMLELLKAAPRPLFSLYTLSPDELIYTQGLFTHAKQLEQDRASGLHIVVCIFNLIYSGIYNYLHDIGS